jgi:hypothetical protein
MRPKQPAAAAHRTLPGLLTKGPDRDPTDDPGGRALLMTRVEHGCAAI